MAFWQREEKAKHIPDPQMALNAIPGNMDV